MNAINDCQANACVRGRVGVYWFFLFFCGVLFFYMTQYTPLMTDDWRFCFICNTHVPISSFSDVFKSLKIHYQEENGRLFPHFIAYSFEGFLGKSYFNFFNALVFILFIHGIVLLVHRKIDQASLSIAFFAIVALFLTPSFKICFLWMTGSFNYLWSATLLIYYTILVFKEFKKTVTVITYIFLFLISILCGWTHEGIAVGFAVAFFVFFIRNRDRQTKLRFFMFLGFCIGVSLLVFAPANLIRLDFYSSEIPFLRLYTMLILDMLKKTLLFDILIIFLIIKFVSRKSQIKPIVIFLFFLRFLLLLY